MPARGDAVTNTGRAEPDSGSNCLQACVGICREGERSLLAVGMCAFLLPFLAEGSGQTPACRARLRRQPPKGPKRIAAVSCGAGNRCSGNFQIAGQRSMTDRKNNERALWAWTLLASIGIAVADSLVPSRFNFEFAYILPVLLSLQSVRESFAYYSAFVNTCLLLCSMFASLGGRAEFGVFMANHLFAVGLIWAAAFLCALRHHSIAVERNAV